MVIPSGLAPEPDDALILRYPGRRGGPYIRQLRSLAPIRSLPWVGWV
jgi:hypothetical protein